MSVVKVFLLVVLEPILCVFKGKNGIFTFRFKAGLVGPVLGVMGVLGGRLIGKVVFMVVN
jgi:hypothetical protein